MVCPAAGSEDRAIRVEMSLPFQDHNKRIGSQCKGLVSRVAKGESASTHGKDTNDRAIAESLRFVMKSEPVESRRSDLLHRDTSLLSATTSETMIASCGDQRTFFPARDSFSRADPLRSPDHQSLVRLTMDLRQVAMLPLLRRRQLLGRRRVSLRLMGLGLRVWGFRVRV